MTIVDTPPSGQLVLTWAEWRDLQDPETWAKVVAVLPIVVELGVPVVPAAVGADGVPTEPANGDLVIFDHPDLTADDIDLIAYAIDNPAWLADLVNASPDGAL